MDTPAIETRWMCIECHKKEIAPHADYCRECTEKRYSRIDGWLWLPLISLFLFIVSGIYSLLDYYTVLNDGYPLPRNMLPTLHIMAITDILYIAGAIITLTFFLKRSRLLPRVFTGFILLYISAEALIFASIIGFIPSSAGFLTTLPLIKALIYAMIWLFYFRVSDRVKKTFIH